MKNKTYATIGLGILASGLFLGLTLTSRESVESLDTVKQTVAPAAQKKEYSSPTAREDIAGLRKDIDRLDRERRALQQELTATNRELVALRQREPPNAIAQKVIEQEPSPEEELQRAETYARTRASLLEETLNSEPLDSTWASLAQTAIGDAFHLPDLAGAQLVEAECRMTICRTKLMLSEGTMSRDIFRDLIQLSQWPGESFAQIDPQSSELVIYLSREGHAFPQITE